MLLNRRNRMIKVNHDQTFIDHSAAQLTVHILHKTNFSHQLVSSVVTVTHGDQAEVTLGTFRWMWFAGMVWFLCIL